MSTFKNLTVAPVLSRRDGFGHVAFKVHDVNEICDELDSSGVKFQSPSNL